MLYDSHRVDEMSWINFKEDFEKKNIHMFMCYMFKPKSS